MEYYTTRNKRQSFSLNSYKNSFKNSKIAPPSYFSYGERYWNIVHTRLRHNCVLNKDLFRWNIFDSHLCSCGKPEDAYHFFFSCNKYPVSRNELFNVIFRMESLHIVDTRVLLWGDNFISDKENEKLFSYVQLFIKKNVFFYQLFFYEFHVYYIYCIWFFCIIR